MGRWARATCILLFALLLLGCGSAPTPGREGVTSPTSGDLTVATYWTTLGGQRVPTLTPASLAAGPLSGSVHGHVACFWLGSGVQRVPIEWPRGVFARLEPMRTMNQAGLTIVTVGPRVTLGGGVIPLGKPRRVQGCGLARQVFLAAGEPVGTQ